MSAISGQPEAGAIIPKGRSGFAKGQSGNPSKQFKKGSSGNPGGGSKRQRENRIFGEWLREVWLERIIKVTQGEGKPDKKIRRMDELLNRLFDTKPEIILHYALGKPVEQVNIGAVEGGNVEFVVKVSGGELP